MFHKIKIFWKTFAKKIKSYKLKHPLKYGLIRICLKNILRYITVGYSTIIFTIYGLYKQIKSLCHSKENFKSSNSSAFMIIAGTVALGLIVYKKIMETYYGLPELPEKSPAELKKEAEWAEWEDRKKEIEEKKRDEEWTERQKEIEEKRMDEDRKVLIRKTEELADSRAKILAENQAKGLEKIQIMENRLFLEEEKSKYIVSENKIKKWELEKQKSLESWVKSEVSDAYEIKKKKAFDLLQSKNRELESVMETVVAKEKEFEEATNLKRSGPEVDKLKKEFSDAIKTMLTLEKEVEILAEIQEKEFSDELEDLSQKEKWKI